MAYELFALAYADVTDRTRTHGLDANVESSGHLSIVLNARGNESERDAITMINLAEVVNRVFVSAEPKPETALPHQIRQWADKLKSAIQRSHLELSNVSRLAYAGKLLNHNDDTWDDPGIRKLALAVGEARDLARLLVVVGDSRGLHSKPLFELVREPISILNPEQTAAAIPVAEAIAATV